VTDVPSLREICDALDTSIAELQAQYENRRGMLEHSNVSDGFFRSLLGRAGALLVTCGYWLRQKCNPNALRPRSDEEVAAMLDYLTVLVRAGSDRWLFELHADPPNPDAHSATGRDWVWDSVRALLRPAQEQLKPSNATALMASAGLDNPIDALAVLRASGAWAATAVLLWALVPQGDADAEIRYQDLKLALNPESDDFPMMEAQFQDLPFGAALASEPPLPRWSTFPPPFHWPNKAAGPIPANRDAIEEPVSESADG